MKVRVHTELCVYCALAKLVENICGVNAWCLPIIELHFYEFLRVTGISGSYLTCCTRTLGQRELLQGIMIFFENFISINGRHWQTNCYKKEIA